jgi:tRNA pseudouridine(38-40) synthase
MPDTKALKKKRDGGKKEPRPPNKRKKADDNIKRNHTWQSDENRKVVHPGSYANPVFCQLFNVTLPYDINDSPQQPATSKKKVGFLLGYLGTAYSGFQINEGQRTLQAEFELALYKCRLLDPRNFGFPHKYGWSISGRTDKGVHACAQVCSAKIELLPEQTLGQVLHDLNAVLPSDFRVLDIVRATRNFCAHTQRDQVRYQYMIPSLVFSPQVKPLLQQLMAHADKEQRPPNHPLTRDEIAQLQEALQSYRVTPMQLNLLKECLASYEGTHSFHNFTKGVHPTEARAARYILSFTADEPVLHNGVEWIPTQVLGQSFLLHQIRKMVSMAMQVTRGASSLETLRQALTKECRVKVDVAPAQGLYLDMSYYTGYNRRKQENPDLDDMDWTRPDEPAYQRWKDFKDNVVMKHVIEEEAKEGNFLKYLFLQEYYMEQSKDPEESDGEAEDN